MNQPSEQVTADEPDAEAKIDPESFGKRLNRAVGTVAKRMQSGALSTGDMAELRRISPSAPYTPTLWRVLHELGEQDAPRWMSQMQWERRWAALFMGMAFGSGLHDYNVPLGRALAEAGWSEVRFTRLMEEKKGRGLATRVRRLAQYLASKKQRANWADVARMLFYQSGEAAENIRLGVARSYYRAVYAKGKE